MAPDEDGSDDDFMDNHATQQLKKTRPSVNIRKRKNVGGGASATSNRSRAAPMRPSRLKKQSGAQRLSPIAEDQPPLAREVTEEDETESESQVPQRQRKGFKGLPTLNSSEALGFGPLLTILPEAVESRGLLPWLMDRIRPEDMIIRIGPGKILPITPQIIRMVVGLPNGGGNTKLYTWQQAVEFRRQLIRDLDQEYLTDDDPIDITNLQEEILKGRVDQLMLRCFFMILFNRLLFPTSSYFIGSSDIKRAMEPETFGGIDWSQALFDDIQLAVRRWHDRNKKQKTQSIYSCAIFLIVYYLDNLHHNLSLPDWILTPRISLYDKKLIEALTIADRIRGKDGTISYGLVPFKSWTSTCYAAAMIPDDGHGAIGDQPAMSGQDIPRLRDLLSQPLALLTGRPMRLLRDFFGQFDTVVAENSRAIQAAQGRIVRAQLTLAEQCRPLIEELIADQRSGNLHRPVPEASRRKRNEIPEPGQDSQSECAGEFDSAPAQDGVSDDGHGEPDEGHSKSHIPHEPVRPDLPDEPSNNNANSDPRMMARARAAASFMDSLRDSGDEGEDTTQDMAPLNGLIDAIYAEEAAGITSLDAERDETAKEAGEQTLKFVQLRKWDLIYKIQITKLNLAEKKLNRIGCPYFRTWAKG
ncbi:hypothetical protein EJB05_34399, partial [Eragrostis curvula]